MSWASSDKYGQCIRQQSDKKFGERAMKQWRKKKSGWMRAYH